MQERSKAERWKKDNRRLQSEIGDLRARNFELQSKIAGLEGELADCRSELTSLGKRVVGEGEVMRLRQEAREARVLVTKASEECAAALAERGRAVSQGEEALSRANAKIKAFELRVGQAEVQSREQQGLKAATDKELSEARSALSGARGRAARAEKVAGKLEARLEGAEKRAREAEEGRSRMLERLAEMEASLEGRQKREAQLERELGEARKEIGAHKARAKIMGIAS